MSHHVLCDPSATISLGRHLAERWLALPPSEPKPILLLRGDLGAGKTCLVQGIAAGLGISEPITSPSFALAQHYRGAAANQPTALVHLDLYRLEQTGAADELFAQEEEEALELGAMMAVEWSERLGFMPEGAWVVQLQLIRPDRPEAGRQAVLQLGPQT